MVRPPASALCRLTSSRREGRSPLVVERPRACSLPVWAKASGSTAGSRAVLTVSSDPQRTVVGEADVENVVGVVGGVTVADRDGVAAVGDGLSVDRNP